MSMHVNAHNAHRCVVRFKAIFLATGVLSHRLHHLQRFNRRCPSSWFWDIYTLRTCLCLSADPLFCRKKQKSTIACTCLSRTINSAKWTSASTLQRILTGSSNPDWKLESAWKVQDCEATPEFSEYPFNQSTRYSFGHLSDSLRQGILWPGDTKPTNAYRISATYKKMIPKAVSRAEVQQNLEDFVTLISCHSFLVPSEASTEGF